MIELEQPSPPPPNRPPKPRLRARRSVLRLLAANLVLACIAVAAPADEALWRGTIRVDIDRDGVADPDEPGLPGVAVSNGLDLVRSDDGGRYAIAARPGEALRITCPDDFECPVRYRKDEGDFALLRDFRPDDFFFVQITDAHVFGKIEDFARYSAPHVPRFVPAFLQSFFAYRLLTRLYPEHDRAFIGEALRQALPEPETWADASPGAIYQAWSKALMAGTLPAGSPRAQVMAAFEEVAGLHPGFVVDTGDLWLEGNKADPDAALRWARLFDAASAKLGVPVWNTIGNNEIVGNENDAVSPDDPRFGKALFEARYGPTLYSFDEGPFHFIALDTHRITQRRGDRTWWDFYHYSNPARAWLRAELEANVDRVLVVLNHEPFHYDPSWHFDDPEWAVDEGFFEHYGVDYVLAGHTHRNGFEQAPGGTTHITTGALSGLRWVLPASLHERGYRLFFAKDGRLYSAWKRLGQPVVGFVTPVDPAAPGPIHPASKRPADATHLEGVVDIVVVAADVSGPFDDFALELDGRPLPHERWGDYFARARVDAARLPASGGRLRLIARRRAPTSDPGLLDARSSASETQEAELHISPDR